MLFRVLPLLCSATAGLAMCVAAQAAEVSTDVPVDIQRIVIARLGPSMLLPERAIWRFAGIRPYMSGSQVVCGTVNFQSSTHRYFGPLGFYVVLRRGMVSVSGIEPTSPDQDPVGALEFAYRSACVDH